MGKDGERNETYMEVEERDWGKPEKPGRRQDEIEKSHHRDNLRRVVFFLSGQQ